MPSTPAVERRVVEAMPPPSHGGAEVGGVLPPARLKLSKSLQMHLYLPGLVRVLPALWSGGDVSASSPPPPTGAAPPGVWCDRGGWKPPTQAGPVSSPGRSSAPPALWTP